MHVQCVGRYMYDHIGALAYVLTYVHIHVCMYVHVYYVCEEMDPQ